MAEPIPAVVAKGIVARRGGRVILHDLDMTIEKGAPFAIVGRSGSGKTTLLMALAGLRPPDAGEIRIASKELSALGPRERAQCIGMVFQDHQLFPHLTVMENVLLAPQLAGHDGAPATAERLLQELGLADLGGRRPHELSGGQRQRVAIARALALSPEVLLFDEPSASLDAETSRTLADLLVALSARTQVVVVSHDLPFVERSCSTGICLADGRVIASGEISQIVKA